MTAMQSMDSGILRDGTLGHRHAGDFTGGDCRRQWGCGRAGDELRVVRGRRAGLLHGDASGEPEHQSVAQQARQEFAALGVVQGRGTGHPPRHRRRLPRRRLSLQGLLRRVGVHGKADLRCAGLRVPRGREGHRLVPVSAGVHRLAAGPRLLRRVPQRQADVEGGQHPHFRAADVAKGVVFFDFIKYNTLTYYSASIVPEKVAQRRRPVPDERRFPKPERVTEAELAGIRKLLGGADEKRPGIAEAQVNDLCDKVKALGIVRDEHGVRGPGIDGGSYYCSQLASSGARTCGTGRTSSAPTGPLMPNPGPMSSLAAEVARAYRASNDAQQRRRLAEAFLLIADHLQDQGQAVDVDARLA